jgi:hypothetical protein
VQEISKRFSVRQFHGHFRLLQESETGTMGEGAYFLNDSAVMAGEPD